MAGLETSRKGRSGPPTIPNDCPPSFVASAGPGDKIHAAWCLAYFSAMLYAGVPNTEIHLYAKGRHGQLPRGAGPGSHVGAWTDRLIECECLLYELYLRRHMGP